MPGQQHDDSPRERPQNRPDPPDGWRDMLRSDYEYPEDFDGLARRDRRAAKRRWRREDYAERMDWLRDQRGSEPTSPAAVIAVVLLLGLVVLGLGGGLPRLLGGNDTQHAPVGLLTPADRLPVASTSDLPVTDEGTSLPSQSAPPSAGATGTPPPVSQRPGAAATATVDQIAGAWARTFFTRTPATETYAQLVARAGRYTTAEVSDGYTKAGDSTYESLRTSRGASQVLAAPVTAPRAGTVPVDTPSRITRLVTVDVAISGSSPGRIGIPLLVTVTGDGGQWLISDITGGTGT